MQKKEISGEINEDVVMSELTMDKNNLWSFLLFSGYLKPIEKRKENNLRIPI